MLETEKILLDALNALIAGIRRKPNDCRYISIISEAEKQVQKAKKEINLRNKRLMKVLNPKGGK